MTLLKEIIDKITTLTNLDEIFNEDDWFDKLITSWTISGLKLNDKASNQLIAMTEEIAGFNFPSDFIDFYKKHNGFDDWDIIGNMFCIWNLERIQEEYEKSNDKNFIPFCDYLIDAYRIGYIKNEIGVFKEFDQSKQIARTFKDTIKLIIEDSIVLY